MSLALKDPIAQGGASYCDRGGALRAARMSLAIDKDLDIDTGAARVSKNHNEALPRYGGVVLHEAVRSFWGGSWGIKELYGRGRT